MWRCSLTIRSGHCIRCYQLVDETQPTIQSWSKRCLPGSGTGYVLKDLTNDELAQSTGDVPGLLVLYLIEQIQNNPDQAAEMLGDLPFDPSQIRLGWTFHCAQDGTGSA